MPSQAYFRTGMMLVLLQQLVLAALIATFSRHIVAFFCSDAAVMHIARGVVPILALNIVFDGVNVVLNGVLRACGRQALGARLQLCSYWLLGVPLAYFLGIKLGLGPKGFVAASGLASLTQALLCCTIFARWV
ncbi:multidrug and toxic compound extrusion protein, partial [Haematococcus lacustris]